MAPDAPRLQSDPDEPRRRLDREHAAAGATLGASTLRLVRDHSLDGLFAVVAHGKGWTGRLMLLFPSSNGSLGRLRRGGRGQAATIRAAASLPCDRPPDQPGRARGALDSSSPDLARFHPAQRAVPGGRRTGLARFATVRVTGPFFGRSIGFRRPSQRLARSRERRVVEFQMVEIAWADVSEPLRIFRRTPSPLDLGSPVDCSGDVPRSVPRSRLEIRRLALRNAKGHASGAHRPRSREASQPRVHVHGRLRRG